MSERREYQRLKLLKPILGTVDGQGALILDIGIGGAFIEHYGQFPVGGRFRLGFLWEGSSVEFICEVRRCVTARRASDDTIVSHTGGRFVEAIDDSQELLERMMTSFLANILEAQRANARGERGISRGESILARLGDARRMRARGFVSYHFEDGKWSAARSESPRQPDNGFTVAAFEDEDDLKLLRESYETADEEGRRLIRLVAELTARGARRH